MPGHWLGLHNRQFFNCFQNFEEKYFVEVNKTVPLVGNRESASAAMFFSNCMYSISGLYSYNINLHRNTLSVLKVLHVHFLLSVYIFNL